MPEKNYYDILFVTRDATEDEIKNSYRRLALRYHPDKNEKDPANADCFNETNEAYRVLGNQEKGEISVKKNNADGKEQAVD